jgi:hypothetical protein
MLFMKFFLEYEMYISVVLGFYVVILLGTKMC